MQATCPNCQTIHKVAEPLWNGYKICNCGKYLTTETKVRIIVPALGLSKEYILESVTCQVNHLIASNFWAGDSQVKIDLVSQKVIFLDG